MMDLYPLLRPILFRLDPEIAHFLTLKSLPLATRLGLPELVHPADANTTSPPAARPNRDRHSLERIERDSGRAPGDAGTEPAR